jgi:hypothetical protein
MVVFEVVEDCSTLLQNLGLITRSCCVFLTNNYQVSYYIFAKAH